MPNHSASPDSLEVKKLEKRSTPAEWLEYAPILSILIATLGLAYIAQVLAVKGPMAALDLNTYNLLFLMMGLLLHWRPRSFVRAVNDAVPATAGVLHAVSVLRRNFRDHHVFRAGREAGSFFCEFFHDKFVSHRGFHLFSCAGNVRAVRRKQMDY